MERVEKFYPLNENVFDIKRLYGFTEEDEHKFFTIVIRVFVRTSNYSAQFVLHAGSVRDLIEQGLVKPENITFVLVQIGIGEGREGTFKYISLYFDRRHIKEAKQYA